LLRDDWIAKDYDSRRYWIGGEVIPSRDHIIEKREQRFPRVGFIQMKTWGRVASYKVFRIGFMYMYERASGDMHMYVGV